MVRLGEFIDMALSGKIKLLYDDRILSEYLDVLPCPGLAIQPEQARAAIDHIRLSRERVAATPLPER